MGRPARGQDRGSHVINVADALRSPSKTTVNSRAAEMQCLYCKNQETVFLKGLAASSPLHSDHCLSTHEVIGCPGQWWPRVQPVAVLAPCVFPEVRGITFIFSRAVFHFFVHLFFSPTSI